MSAVSKEKENVFFFQLSRSHFLARTSRKNHQCSDISCLYIPSLLADEVFSSPLLLFSPHCVIVYVNLSYFSLFFSVLHHSFGSFAGALLKFVTPIFIRIPFVWKLSRKKRWTRYIGILLALYFSYTVSVSVCMLTI